MQDIGSKINWSIGELTGQLLDRMNPDGFWEGRLSNSALAAAVAIVALSEVDRNAYSSEISRGVAWLIQDQNADGGWGDSPESLSNLSTTLLCWSALNDRGDSESVVKAEFYIRNQIGSTEPHQIARGILNHYGMDRTFSAPILALCAVAGRLGDAPQCWRYVPQLPLEPAVFPQRFFSMLQLPVVSYAIPALIAIGLVRHTYRPSWNPVLRFIRNRLIPNLLSKLAAIQPTHGGYLEAVPLTAFVTMSLASAGYGDHAVVKHAVTFLLQSQREEGSWPIDTNLSTWATTLSVKAMPENALSDGQQTELKQWLLNQQMTERHPFTSASPGGWAWTDLPGGVPDADDTAGALLALHRLDSDDPLYFEAARHGVQWLLNLQNRDGGIPTFCRGWGKLPFDRSCPDITAHAIRAWLEWKSRLPIQTQKRVDSAVEKGISYLKRIQRDDGAWTPLWFGNQRMADHENPVYGTAQVLIALNHPELTYQDDVKSMRRAAAGWLSSQQNADGGWGRNRENQSTIEETGLALSALACWMGRNRLERGVHWLIDEIGQPIIPEPIGLYFASLWYSEEIYPIVFALGGLNCAARRFIQQKTESDVVLHSESTL